MVNKVFVDSGGLLQILVIGPQTRESVREMGEKLGFYVRQLRTESRPVLILDNLIQLGRTTSEARAEVARLARSLDYDRAAMVGDGSWPMRYGTNLMLRAIGRSNVRYFSNLGSAEKWLKAFYQERVVG
ncbi:MAG TPA: STAS/SEC14 domain-containing protein [Candidatus Saccharimonadia bacterium]|jgi:UDP-N-acetylmuramyl pentapeptide synthase